MVDLPALSSPSDPSPSDPGPSDPGPSDPKPSSHGARDRLITIARPAVAVLVLLAIAYAVSSQWSGVHHALHSLAWPSVVLSLLACMAGAVTSLMAWRAMLAAEGHPLSPIAAGRIFFVGQLGKYLPGSVFSIVLQMELGKRAGVPRARAFTTSLAWVGLSLSTGLCVGMVGFPVIASAHHHDVWLLLVVLPFAVVASLPPVLTRLVNLLLRIMRKSPLPQPLTWRGVGHACLWLVATWLLLGLHLWLLANALGAPGWGGITRCIGGMALAITAGVLFVVVPSGAGVREAIIVAALAPVMSAGEALGIAVVSRGLFITSDILTAGVAGLSGIRQLRAERKGAAAIELPD
jgi:glycosyltransferase 2 family protein